MSTLPPEDAPENQGPRNPVPAAALERPNAPAEVANDNVHTFSFHGTGSSFFALILVNMLLTIVTFGIYLPWSKTERRKYLWQNIEVRGHRLRYHGTGQELFIGYLKVAAGYLVFIGLPFIARKMLGNTVGTVVQVALVVLLIPLIPLAIWGSQRYRLSRTSWRGVHFRLEGDRNAYIKTFILGYLLTLVTLGFYGPIWMNKLHRLIMNATALGTCPFEYRGEDRAVFKIAIKGILLSILTLGIYAFWYQAELMRYQFQNTWLDGAHAECNIKGGDLFGLILLQMIGLTLTLGFAFPWIMVYTMQFSLRRIRLVGPIDFARIHQAPAAGNAAADGLADALDVGVAL